MPLFPLLKGAHGNAEYRSKLSLRQTDDADTAALPATLTLPAHFPAVSLEASCSTIELHSLLPRIMLKPCAIGKNLLYTNQ
ncbi:hypothetical protein SAMN04487769_1378 [Burkholderia sp. b14]|nr:hypothetical protein SAMN04487769_1378 [Burkholderia sp. b14]